MAKKTQKNKKIKNIEEFYKIINKVQLKNKETFFYIKDEVLKPVCFNILKDLDLKYKSDSNGLVRVFPNEKYTKDVDSSDDIEFLFDQIF